MSQLSQIIRELQNTQGSKAKQAVLERESKNMLLVNFLYSAYEPRLNYYMSANALKKHVAFKRFVGDVQREFDNIMLEQIRDTLTNRILTGTAAKDYVTNFYNLLDADDQHLIECLLDGDIRSSVSGTMINKVWPNLVSYSAYQRCVLPKDVDLQAWFDSGEVIFSQTKADGTFTNFRINADKSFSVTSRQGKPYPPEPFKRIADQLSPQVSESVVFHGEMLVQDQDGVVLAREVGNGILNALSQGEDLPTGHSIVYGVWDVVPVSAMVKKGSYKVPYKVRLDFVRDFVGTAGMAFVIPTIIVETMAEARADYKAHLARGEEGTIIKNGGGMWGDGDSKFQVKLKQEVDVELKCVGFREAVKGKHMATFGSMLFQTEDGLCEVGVSGFKDAQRKEIHSNRTKYVGSVWTIRVNDIMYTDEEGKLHSLYLPRAIEHRKDKTVADTFQRVIDQFEAAIKGI